MKTKVKAHTAQSKRSKRSRGDLAAQTSERIEMAAKKALEVAELAQAKVETLARRSGQRLQRTTTKASVLADTAAVRLIGHAQKAARSVIRRATQVATAAEHRLQHLASKIDDGRTNRPVLR